MASTDQDLASPFEPVGVTAEYERPRGNVHHDRSRRWFRRMFPLLRAHFGHFGLALGAAAAGLFMRVEIPRVTMDAIDNALVARTDPLGGYVRLLVLMGLSLFAFGFVFRFFLLRLGFEVDNDLRVLMFEQFQRLSFGFFDRNQTGQLVSRANSDIRAVQVFLTFSPMIVVSILTFFLALYRMVQIHVPLTLVALATSPLVFLVGRTMRTRLFPISWLQAARQADLSIAVEENVSGTNVVKSFAAERRQIERLERIAQRLRWVSIRQADNRAFFGPMMQNLPRLALALILLYSGRLVIDGQVSIGALFAFNAYVMMLQLPFMMLGFLMMMAQRASASAHRIFEVLDQTPEIVERPGAFDLETCHGHLDFDHVTFRYGDGPVVLDDLCLSIRPGETVAVVGRTGCGKSTLARLIPRFYDVELGHVRVDAHDVRDYTLASLRSHVGLVLDENFLFADTIWSNIAFGRPDATHDDVVAAATAAGAHDFILATEHGYDSVIGERGYTLSGGQRQRIAIARTLLLNPKILVLDDATSAVDAHREREIHGALRTLMEGRTTIVIAHRISTLSLAERVVLLEGGRVVAEGTHEVLMMTEPRYAEVLAEAALDEEDWARKHEKAQPRRPSSHRGGVDVIPGVADLDPASDLGGTI
jgi:ATP-binding cassette subfamily B protein